MTIKIIGTGVGLPARHITNDELAAIAGLDTSDEWIVTRTGIRSRYLCVEETATDLATAAARQALEDAGLAPAEIGYVLCSTIGGDTRTPSLACQVSARLGLTAPAIDLNGGCTGFLYELDLAAGLISTGRADAVLLITTEKMSAHLDWRDRSTCVLFGDGAAACVVTAGSMLKYLHLTTQPDTQAITMMNDMAGNSPLAQGQAAPTFVQMDGQRVFKYAVSLVEHEVAAALDTVGLTAGEIDYYLLHQANRRIIDFAISRLGLPPERFPVNIDRYGNVSSVSIPLLLHELRQGDLIHPGQWLLLCAFGSGLTGGSCVWQWE